MRNKRKVRLCLGQGKDERKKNGKGKGSRSGHKRGNSRVLSELWWWETEEFREAPRAQDFILLLSLGLGNGKEHCAEALQASMEQRSYHTARMLRWEVEALKLSWEQPLGWVLNAVGVHSGVCSLPGLRESSTAKGSWPDPSGSIAGGNL